MDHYGAPLNCIVYQNRMVTTAFALGDKPVPQYRRRISIVLNGKYMGMIHAVHGIKVLGIPSCSFFPAIGDAACDFRVRQEQGEPALPEGRAQDRSGGGGSQRCSSR